jgi:ornithine cyclodeaminase
MSADIITCATTSRQAIIKGEWIQAGTHLDLVGGFKPDMREVDDELMAKSVVFVDTFTGALAEAGDILQALQSGSLKKEAIVAELADLCSGRHTGRRSEQEVTVFKSVGTALEDLCAANLVWQSHQQEANEKASARVFQQ